MTDQQLQLAFSALDTWRQVIAAGKTQRWDVVKWAVTVNLGLTTVSAAIEKLGLIPFALACLVALASIFLVLHYNNRMVGARRAAQETVNWMKNNGLDCDPILGSVDTTSKYYDKQELIIFSLILSASAILPALVFLGRHAAWL
jgi:hypothetical protein